MTRKEKEAYLYSYCEHIGFGCAGCILNNETHNWENCLHDEYKCLAVSVSSDDEVDKAIEIIKSTGYVYEPPAEAVNHPPHYNYGKIEVIDYIEDKNLNFNLGNAVKYISRAGKKDKSKEVEDLQKAVFYINREIDRLKNN